MGTLAGFSLGALLMLGCAALLSEAAMHDWGWRLPFLVAAPLGIAGLYLRSHIEDTPVFREVERIGGKERGHLRELRDLLRHYRRPLLVLVLLVIALNVVNYTLLSYMPTYLQLRLGLSAQQALYVPIVGMLLMMPFLPIAGALSDRLGRKPLWWASPLGLFRMAIPAYHLMATGIPGGDRLRLTRIAVHAPVGDDLFDISGDVPDTCPVCRRGDRL